MLNCKQTNIHTHKFKVVYQDNTMARMTARNVRNIYINVILMASLSCWDEMNKLTMVLASSTQGGAWGQNFLKWYLYIKCWMKVCKIRAVKSYTK